VTLTITDETMTSDETSHNACRLWTEANPGADEWSVSWLPGRRLTRNETITAMTLAEVVASGIGDHTDKRWPHIDGWAAELGLSGPDAVGKISAITEVNLPDPATHAAYVRELGSRLRPGKEG
jgi:hypothetical protein